MIGGTTVHSGLAIQANRPLHDFAVLNDEKKNSLQNAYRDVKCVIIDEVSMVGYCMFRYISMRLCEIFRTAEPFGGRHIITFGDLYQMAPVMDSPVFQMPANKPKLERELFPLWHLFKVYELKTIMRQREDKLCAEMFNRVRLNEQTDEDIVMLESRNIDVNKAMDLLGTDGVVFATAQNSRVNELNERQYGNLTGVKVEWRAHDIFQQCKDDAERKRAEEKLEEINNRQRGVGGKDTARAAKFLRVAVGQQVEICKNMDLRLVVSLLYI